MTMDAASARLQLTGIADRLEVIFNHLVDARDAAPPSSPDKTELRRLCVAAENAMTALDKRGL